MRNFYEAQKMENSVKNYAIEEIVNFGCTSNRKKKKKDFWMFLATVENFINVMNNF